MNAIQIGYARVSTADQDLTSQRDALLRLVVLDSNIYVDHGLTGTNRVRPGLREALAADHEGDTFVVSKLDRLARSVKAPATSPTRGIPGHLRGAHLLMPRRRGEPGERNTSARTCLARDRG